MRRWLFLVVSAGVVAAYGVTAGQAAPPQAGILAPAGGGVRIAYAANGLSAECRFTTSRSLACGVYGKGGRLQRGFAASMNDSQVVFQRVVAGRSTALLTVAQAPGLAVYGDYAPDPHPRLIRLAKGAEIGFLGTNIACEASQDGRAPALRCLAHGGQGLPGPCCGPNYPLLAGSHGFFLSPRRLRDLVVTGTGVGGSQPPFRTEHEWRR